MSSTSTPVPLLVLALVTVILPKKGRQSVSDVAGSAVVLLLARGRSLCQDTVPDLDVTDPPAIVAAYRDRLAFLQVLDSVFLLLDRIKEKALDLEFGVLVA